MQSVESVSIGHRRYRFSAFLFAQKDEREVTYYGMGIFSDCRQQSLCHWELLMQSGRESELWEQS